MTIPITQKQIDARKTNYVVEIIFQDKGKKYKTCGVLAKILESEVGVIHNSIDEKSIDYEKIAIKNIISIRHDSKVQKYVPV